MQTNQLHIHQIASVVWKGEETMHSGCYSTRILRLATPCLAMESRLAKP
jgi:hypothetical protein